jgi:predicted dehydrogenase
MKILIIGKNFALKTHYVILKKIFPQAEFYLASRTMSQKKNINKTIDYKKFLLQNKINIISCCTDTITQENFINFFVKNKIKTNYLMLEKPVSRKIYYIKKINSYCLKNKISFNVNFSYSNMKIFQILKKNFLNKRGLNLYYKLYFKHQFFSKNNNNWKTYSKLGGGICFYYLIHVFFVLNKIFKKITLKKINYLINKNNFINKIHIIFKTNGNNFINLDINVNSKKKIHYYKIMNKSGNIHSYVLNHWNGRSSFNIVDTKINKVVKSLNFNEDINFLTRVNYKNLLLKVSLKKNPLFFRPILNAHKLCVNINKKILKNDFE